MDVHRCRFVPYPPSAINAVAFSHPTTRTNLHHSIARLAIGRANGDIEIWNPLNGAWLQETVIQGGKDRSIDGLVWVTEPDEDTGDGKIIAGKARLFSIGYTTAVTEWDLEKLRPEKHASGQHGDIWCLAAQPPATKALGTSAEGITKLVAGTIDGALAVYSIEDNELRFQRLLVKSPSKKTQMVSIAFQSRNVVIVGCSDSTLRAYDMRNGSMLRKMALGADLVGGARDIIVWSVKCLPGGDFVSGDSTGQVCIWDGKTYTQAQRLQSHNQDVLSLAASADGSSIMSGGMDRRTVLYKKTTGSGARWGKVWNRKYHDHDVKAMASFESGRMSIVVSGGPDATPVVLPLKGLGKENHRTLPSLPQSPPMQSASKARLVMSWWDREIHIWKLKQTFDGLYNGADEIPDLDKNRKLLKTILVKGESSITSASISTDGSLLVVSTATDIKAFHLKHDSPSKPSDIKLSQIEVSNTITSSGATKVQLSPDGDWLCLVQEGTKVMLLRVHREGQTPDDTTYTIHPRAQIVNRLRRNIPKQQTLGGLGNYERSITHVAFAPDGRMLAVTDLAGYIDTWVLRGPQNGAIQSDDNASSSGGDSSDGEEDGHNTADATDERWVRNPKATLLPKLPAPPVVLSFSQDSPQAAPAEPASPSEGWGGLQSRIEEPVADYTLIAVTTSWHILAFHPLQGSLTAWSRRNHVSRLPETIRNTRDLAKGLLWQGKRVWIYGVSFLFMLDLSQDLSAPAVAPGATSSEVVPNGGTAAVAAGTKRKRNGPDSGAGNRMDIGSLVPQRVDRFLFGGHKLVEEDRDMEAPEPPSSDEEMDDDSESDELKKLRGRDTQAEESSTGKTKWWYTYKYRPILGIAALEGSEKEEGWPSSVEAVLVERPIWDVDLPERYFGANEWER